MTDKPTPTDAATPECLTCSDHGAVGNSGFDYKTAADFLSGKKVSDEALRKFVAASRGAHDARAALHAKMLSLQGELASREAEIALLKRSLLDAEADAAAPQPPTAPATQQAGEVRRAELVPGVMHCAKCKFQLNRVTLCVSDGNAYAGNNKTEPCPNGCGPLWPVTWEQEAKNCWKALEEMHERLMAAAAPQPSPTAQSADSVPAVSDLPPLPAPDLRDVGTKPQEIKEFLKGYATEYARTAIAASARAADRAQEDAARSERERICAAIKVEDDYCVEQGDYMLDSDDCIKIARGDWVRPDFSVDAASKQGENHD